MGRGKGNGSDVIVMGVIAVVALAVALTIGLNVTDHDPSHSVSTPLISMLVAVVPLTITSLLALMRTSDTHREASDTREIAEATKAVAEKTHHDLTNGVLTANMRAAIRAVAHEDDVEIAARVRREDDRHHAAERTPDGSPVHDGTVKIKREDGDIPGAPGWPEGHQPGTWREP
jgi:hypothetical protein